MSKFYAFVFVFLILSLQVSAKSVVSASGLFTDDIVSGGEPVEKEINPDLSGVLDSQEEYEQRRSEEEEIVSNINHEFMFYQFMREYEIHKGDIFLSLGLFPPDGQPTTFDDPESNKTSFHTPEEFFKKVQEVGSVGDARVRHQLLKELMESKLQGVLKQLDSSRLTIAAQDLSMVRDQIVRLRRKIAEVKSSKYVEVAKLFDQGASPEAIEAKKKEIEERVVELEILESKLMIDIDQTQSQVIDLFAELNIDISPESAKGLISNIKAEDDMKLFSIYYNIQAILSEMKKEQTEYNDASSPSSYQSYTGATLLMLQALYLLNQNYIIQSDQVIPQRLAKLKSEAEKGLTRVEANDGPKVAKLNYQRTIEAIKIYTRLLDARMKMVLGKSEELRKQIFDVFEIYRSEQIANNLLEIIQNETLNFDKISQINIGDYIIEFENKNLVETLERLNLDLHEMELEEKENKEAGGLN